MLKFVSAVAIAMALCLQPAAAKLGGAHSITETGEQAERQKSFSVTSYVIEQIQISFSIVTGRYRQASESGDEHQYSYKKRECDATSKEADEDAEGADAKAQEPTGPEPLYFGF